VTGITCVSTFVYIAVSHGGSLQLHNTVQDVRFSQRCW